MATFRDTVKGWFQKNDFPTQEQFYQKFDWLWFKDEKFAINDTEGLQEILNQMGSSTQTFTTSGTGAFNYPYTGRDLIEVIVLEPSANCNCVLTEGANILIDEDDIIAADGKPWHVDFFNKQNKTLTITGLPNASKITFIKRKIN